MPSVLGSGDDRAPADSRMIEPAEEADLPSGVRELILRQIIETTRLRGYPPSVRELRDVTGVASTATVHLHLARLERDGYVRKAPKIARSLVVTRKGLDFIKQEPPLY